MARYRESVCRLCRREGMKLFLKGERCNTSKCALERRSYAPGQHGQMRKKLSTYGIQLREKQKAKRIYGIMERQFRRYFEIADRYRGVTGTVLLQLLERRLDNVVFRLGLAPSRAQARQLIRHGHIKVAGRKVDIPSYLVKEGQVITLVPKMNNNLQILRALEVAETQGRSPWLEFDREAMQGKLAYVPSREEIPTPVREQLIVELYSK